jgi:hypothetical protein
MGFLFVEVSSGNIFVKLTQRIEDGKASKCG